MFSALLQLEYNVDDLRARRRVVSARHWSRSRVAFAGILRGMRARESRRVDFQRVPHAETSRNNERSIE